jgi:hypothetical protein
MRFYHRHTGPRDVSSALPTTRPQPHGLPCDGSRARGPRGVRKSGIPRTALDWAPAAVPADLSRHGPNGKAPTTHEGGGAPRREARAGGLGGVPVLSVNQCRHIRFPAHPGVSTFIAPSKGPCRAAIDRHRRCHGTPSCSCKGGSRSRANPAQWRSDPWRPRIFCRSFEAELALPFDLIQV